MKTRLKGSSGQRDMGVERRVQLERFGLAREVPKAKQTPVRLALLGDIQFVAGDVKGRALPSVCRFYLDQSRAAVRRKAGDIVARAIAIFLRHPSHLARKIVAAGRFQGRAFMAQDSFFSGPAKDAVARISGRDIELAGVDPSEALKLVDWE
jgi:hypothetical protein